MVWGVEGSGKALYMKLPCDNVKRTHFQHEGFEVGMCMHVEFERGERVGKGVEKTLYIKLPDDNEKKTYFQH